MAAFKEFVSLCITEMQLNSNINKWLEFGLSHKFLVMPLLQFIFNGEQAWTAKAKNSDVVQGERR